LARISEKTRTIQNALLQEAGIVGPLTLEHKLFNNRVRVRYEDGSVSVFEYASVLVSLDDPGVKIIFTEHCGYHRIVMLGVEIEVEKYNSWPEEELAEFNAMFHAGNELCPTCGLAQDTLADISKCNNLRHKEVAEWHGALETEDEPEVETDAVS
jgi:hypothetical protein